MKNRLSGFLCAGLIMCGLSAPGRAQDAQDQAPQQAPAPAAPAPAQESETGTPKLQVPELPKYTDVLMPGEKGVAIGIGGWFPVSASSVDINKGYASLSPYPGYLALSTKSKINPAVDISIAAGRHNFLHLSYFEATSTGNTNAPEDMTLWTVNYNKGDYLSTAYHLQSFKAAFEYLTWPFPVKTSKFRLRTLWSFEYTGIRSSFNAPLLPLADTSGNPITDANGNAVNYSTQGTRWFALPEIGVGAQYYISRAVNFEINGSGFTIPHHQNSWSADAILNVRLGHYEVRLGGKAFHFRSSPQSEYWMQGTLYGPFVGLRWHSDDVK